jgi:hypothetical protein
LVDIAADMRRDRIPTAQQLILELENTAQIMENKSVRDLGLLHAGMDREARMWLSGWCRGISARLRRYKQLAIQGGRQNLDMLTSSLAHDFVNACTESWTAFDTPAAVPRWEVPWKQLAAKVAMTLALGMIAFYLPHLLSDQQLANQIQKALYIAAAFALISPAGKSIERAHDATKEAFGAVTGGTKP